MADTNQGNEIAIMHAKLEQILELQAEIKEDLKQNKQWSEDHINELKQKINKNEQDIQLLELKLQHLEALHKSDLERVNKKWDTPNKLMFSIFGTVAGVLISAILGLILK